MKLSQDLVKKFIKDGVQDKIRVARKRAKHINMHVTGLGLVDYLEKLDDYENEAQKLLREKLSKSNKSTFSFILRPTDKIFTAKGGSINYNLPSKKVAEVKKMLSNIADGLDIKSYLKKKVKKHYVIDPNGILFCDINPEGKIETYCIPTSEILWYETDGNKVKAIIFEGNKKDGIKDYLSWINGYPVDQSREELDIYRGVEEEDDVTYYRVIDSFTDSIYKRQNDEIELIESSVISNVFGFVPAMILGDEKDYNQDIFESVISDLIDDADILLRRVSVLTVHELSHLYPKYWGIPEACTRCEGEGKIDWVTDATTDPPEIESRTCPSCAGSGMKQRSNPSDQSIIPLDDEGRPITDKPYGYVSPDLQTATFYDKIIKESREEMFRAMWGTTYETAGKRETATGRWLDAEPVADRLKDISYTFSKMHRFLLECYVIVYEKNRNYEASVTYGTRYNFDGPDAILDKYIEVSRENVSAVSQMDMQMRYFEAQYKDDPVQLLKRKKLLKIEPLPTLSLEKALSLGVPDEIKTQKLYFSEWVNQTKDEKIILLTVDELRSEFLTYIKTKTNVETGKAV